jgi:gamma-glutamyltranspeptidase
VTYEQGLDPTAIDGLGQRGHKLEAVTGAGRTQAIAVTSDGKLVGTSDPRGYGKAAGE